MKAEKLSEAIRDMINKEIAPDVLTKQEALSYLEELQELLAADLDSSIDGLRDDIRHDEGEEEE